MAFDIRRWTFDAAAITDYPLQPASAGGTAVTPAALRLLVGRRGRRSSAFCRQTYWFKMFSSNSWRPLCTAGSPFSNV
jgi:hypothetical protein